MIIAEEKRKIIEEMQQLAARDNVPIIRPEAAQLLCKAVEKRQPHFILEIGTAIGYSTLLLAMAAPAAKIVSFEIDAARQNLAQEFLKRAGVLSRVELHLSDIEAYADDFKCDFAFIDAAKGQYPRYLRAILPYLSPTGIVAADNVLFRGYVLGEEKAPRRYRTIVKRLREYLDMVGEEEGFLTKIYAKGDGLAISCRKSCEKDQSSLV